MVVTVGFAADNYVGLFFTKEMEVQSFVWSLIFGGMLLCEFFIMLFFSKKTSFINENIIWVIITLVYPLRSMVFALGLPLPFAIGVSLLRGLAYGLILVVNIRCVSKICGIENVTAAFFIMAIFTAIIQAISIFVFGNVIEKIGYRAFFALVAAVGFAGAIINLLYQLKNNFKYNLKQKNS